MPVLNKINSIFNFPLNNSEQTKRNLFYHPNFIFEETPNGINIQNGVPCNSANSIITANKYGDFVIKKGNITDDQIWLHNDDDTYTIMGVYTDQQVTAFMNDGIQYVSAAGYRLSRTPLLILKDTIIYRDVISDSALNNMKSIMVVTDKQNNIKQVHKITDWDGVIDDCPHCDEILMNTNGTPSFIACITKYTGNNKPTGGFHIYCSEPMYFTINDNGTINTNGHYGIGSSLGNGIGALYDREIIDQYYDTYEYESGHYTTGTYIRSYILNDDGSTTYTSSSEHTGTDKSRTVTFMKINGTIEKVAYTTDYWNNSYDTWLLYLYIYRWQSYTDTYGQLQYYWSYSGTDFRIKQDSTSNWTISYLDFDEKFMYYTEGVTLYKVNIITSVRTLLHTFSEYNKNQLSGAIEEATNIF